jgi:ABC-type lipoprotein export system ATPase subunit
VIYMSRGDIILRLVDVERIYETKEGRKIVALNKVTTSFKRGEFIAVVGKSGSGKSTLINILGGLDTPDSGDYYLEGNNISKINEGHWDAIRNDKIGFIFQEYHLIEYLSVYKNVEIALKYQADTNKKPVKGLYYMFTMVIDYSYISQSVVYVSHKQ